MGTNYHNEVLRKARILERKRNANDPQLNDIIFQRSKTVVDLPPRSTDDNPASSTTIAQSYKFKTDARIRHRFIDNTTEDCVQPLMVYPESAPPPPHRQPRKLHVKV